MKPVVRLFVIAVVFSMSMNAALARNKPINSAVQNVWVQVVPPGKGMVRAITTERKCPIARFDGRPTRMQVRAKPNVDYDVLTCELSIPRHTRDIRVAGRKLKPVSRNPQRIAIVGDTGCRMKGGDAIDDGFQNCDDPDDWEFAKVAEQVARWKPDLIIQLGDYIYREQACPADCNDCQSIPYNSPGMRMDTWNVEFFEPGKPMLEAAPIVLVRGDHEKCERAGSGYFRFLDGRKMQACTDFSDPYALDFEELQLVVMDTVQAEDTKLSPGVVIERYASDFDEAARLATGNTWLMSHRPIWAFRPAADITGDPVQDICGNYETPPSLKLDSLSTTAQDALRSSSLMGILPPEIDLVLVSHVHVGEVLSFTGMRPPQVVIGLSGTKLLPSVPAEDLVNQMLDGERVTDALILSEHGFFTFEPRRRNRWLSTVLDVNGDELARCRIGDKVARCRTD